MRGLVLLAAWLLLPAAAFAQVPSEPPYTPGTHATLPQGSTPAPVPDRLPRGTIMYGGQPNTFANMVSPPGIGGSFAGPINANPFSTTPSASWPPDAALPDGRDFIAGGAGGGMVPNVNQ